MAEVFNNYLFNGEITNGTSVTLITKASGASNNTTTTKGTRTLNSVTQIHSLYLSQDTITKISDVESNGIYVDIIIDNGDGFTTNVANNVCILPHAPFYIEKTITLLSHQSLIIKGNQSNGTTKKRVYAVCSCIDIVD